MIKVGIDIGNSKISTIVCDIKNINSIEALSLATAPTKNVKKSSIINPYLIKEEIRNIINDAEKESQTKIKSVILNIPAIESKSIYTESKIDILGEKINDLHLKKAVNQSSILDLVDNYEIIQNTIIGYELDNKFFSANPSGTFGDKLKVLFYKYSVKKNFINTIKNVFYDLKIQIEDFVPTPLSSALATLSADDKILGSICLDLGASSSSIAIFENDKVVFLDAVGVGGNNITNDLARGIPTDIENAERLKTLYGSVISSPSDEFELIEVPSQLAESSKFRQINRNNINTIIKARVEETLELIWQKLKEYNLHKKQIKNLVLTGGASSLEGIAEYAQIIFDSNVRIGKPIPIKGLDSKFLKSEFSETIGSILFNKKDYEIEFLKNSENQPKNSTINQFFTWLDKYI